MKQMYRNLEDIREKQWEEYEIPTTYLKQKQKKCFIVWLDYYTRKFKELRLEQ